MPSALKSLHRVGRPAEFQPQVTIGHCPRCTAARGCVRNDYPIAVLGAGFGRLRRRRSKRTFAASNAPGAWMCPGRDHPRLCRCHVLRPWRRCVAAGAPREAAPGSAQRLQRARLGSLLGTLGTVSNCVRVKCRMSNTQLSQDGLRYVKKTPGSIITTPRAEAMMSCFKCGKFAFRTAMTSRRLLGKNHLVCAPKCP